LRLTNYAKHSEIVLLAFRVSFLGLQKHGKTCWLLGGGGSRGGVAGSRGAGQSSGNANVTHNRNKESQLAVENSEECWRKSREKQAGFN